MATSGNISWTRGGIFLGIGTCTLSWTRTSYSVENNTSTIQLTFKVYSNISDGGYSKYSYEFKANGEKYNGSLPANISQGWNTIRTVFIDIPHNADGTKTFSYDFWCEYTSGGIVGAQSGVGTLNTIPRPATISSAVDFNDEENPTITYSNISGDGVTALDACISFTGAKDDVPYRAISKTGTSYTFELTSAERATLRKGVASGDSVTVRFYVRTKIGDFTKYSSITKTLSLINHTPTLSPSVIDTNSYTVGLTGSNKKFINHFSNAKLTFGAAARKEATLISRSVTNGSQTIDIEDRAQDVVTINGVDSNTFYLSATDSRGHQVKQALVEELIPYVRLTNNIRKTTMTFNGDLTFTIGGKYFEGSFGAKDNTLEVEFMLEDANGNVITNPDGSGWQVLGTVTPDTDGKGNYTFEYTVSGLDHEMQYTLTVNAIDKLTPVQASSTVVAVVPIFDWSKNDFKFNVPIEVCSRTRITDEGQIHGTTTDGGTIQVIDPCNGNNNLVIGYGNYGAETMTPDGKYAGTNLYGNTVNLVHKNGITINWTTLADFVQEQGSSGTWFYRKWNSGRVELYGYQNVSSAACNTAMGGMYRTAVLTPPNFPFTVSSPKIVATYESEGYGAFIYPTTLTTTAKPFNYYLVRPTSSTAITGKVNFHIQGSWK